GSSVVISWPITDGVPAEETADARSTRCEAQHEAARRIAHAAAPPCLRGEGPGGQPAFLRGHPRHAADRDLVRAHLARRFRPRIRLLPHLLRARRWRRPRLLPIRR